jgi:hypothetical protein
VLSLKEVKSLSEQISFSFGLNKKFPNPFCFHVCSCTGAIKPLLQTKGISNWMCFTHEGELEVVLDKYISQRKKELVGDRCESNSCVEKEEKILEDDGKELTCEDEIIYLSPDSPNTLIHFTQETSFIIGGLVDKTVNKCASLSRANFINIKSAKLPIRSFIKKVIFIK